MYRPGAFPADHLSDSSARRDLQKVIGIALYCAIIGVSLGAFSTNPILERFQRGGLRGFAEARSELRMVVWNNFRHGAMWQAPSERSSHSTSSLDVIDKAMDAVRLPQT